MTTLSMQIEIDAATEKLVQQLASAQQRTPGMVVRDALEQYVEREERRAQLRRDADAAWVDYQETGLHLTGDEADMWLARLEAGEDVPPPACHV